MEEDAPDHDNALRQRGYLTCIREEVEPKVAEIERLRSLVQELVDTGHKMRLAVGDLTVIENAMEDDDGSYGLDDLNTAWIRLAQAAMDWDVTPAKQAGFVSTDTTEK